MLAFWTTVHISIFDLFVYCELHRWPKATTKTFIKYSTINSSPQKIQPLPYITSIVFHTHCVNQAQTYIHTSTWPIRLEVRCTASPSIIRKVYPSSSNWSPQFHQPDQPACRSLCFSTLAAGCCVSNRALNLAGGAASGHSSLSISSMERTWAWENWFIFMITYQHHVCGLHCRVIVVQSRQSVDWYQSGLKF